MIDREHKLSVARQAKLLGFSRGSVYYSPRPVSTGDLALMRRIDELHLEYPFAGSRMLQGLLKAEGHEVGRLHVDTLMKKMGIEAIYRRPNTSIPSKMGTKPITPSAQEAGGHQTQPGLGNGPDLHPFGAGLRLPMCRRGLVQPEGSVMATVDHDGSGLLPRSGEEALARYGKPDIFNTDQGSQFTSVDFTAVLKKAEIAISMDGKGAWRDNVFVERLWRSVKYEEVHPPRL